MERSSKHGARRDEALQHDVEGMLRSGRSTHSEDFVDPEPPADDEPSVTRSPDEPLIGGTPEELSGPEVDTRAQLADALRRSAFPNDAEGLLTAARERGAPERIVAELAKLPDGAEYQNVGEVWRALGHDTEEHRF